MRLVYFSFLYLPWGVDEVALISWHELSSIADTVLYSNASIHTPQIDKAETKRSRITYEAVNICAITTSDGVVSKLRRRICDSRPTSPLHCRSDIALQDMGTYKAPNTVRKMVFGMYLPCSRCVLKWVCMCVISCLYGYFYFDMRFLVFRLVEQMFTNCVHKEYFELLVWAHLFGTAA